MSANIFCLQVNKFYPACFMIHYTDESYLSVHCNGCKQLIISSCESHLSFYREKLKLRTQLEHASADSSCLFLLMPCALVSKNLSTLNQVNFVSRCLVNYLQHHRFQEQALLPPWIPHINHLVHERQHFHLILNIRTYECVMIRIGHSAYPDHTNLRICNDENR